MDLDALERDLLGQIEQAGDEAGLEALRVAALGKKGSVSELLKTLGAMTPEERKERGPLINGLRDRVQGAISQKREALAISAPNVELTWKLGPDEVRQAKIYADRMLALKQIKRLPEDGFIDTRFVDAMRDA